MTGGESPFLFAPPAPSHQFLSLVRPEGPQPTGTSDVSDMMSGDVSQSWAARIPILRLCIWIDWVRVP